MDEKELNYLISKGYTNTEISKELGISLNTIKSYKRRAKVKQIDLSTVCLNCGKPYKAHPNAKKYLFCSTQCRWDYWNEQKKNTEYSLTCEYCGKEFINKGNRKRRFCSRACYCEQERRDKYKDAA